jgi:hypothetical protein
MTTTIVERAKVSLPLSAHATCTTIITTCNKQSAVIKKCTAYNSTPTVQAAVADMDKAVADLKDTDDQLTQAKALVATLEGKQKTQIVTVRLKHDSVESALNTASNGDPAAAKAWVGETKNRAKRVPVGATNAAPEKAALRNVKKHPGMVEASCAEEQGALGYAFQMGTTDLTHPENWPPQVMTRGFTYKVGNLPIGQMVYFRIAVIRRGSIQGQWPPVLQIQVR